MALSGTITGTCDNTNYTLTCEWSATQSVANNTSSITAKVYLKAPSGWSTQSGSWSCVINGTTVTSGASKTVGSTKVLLGQRTWTVNHASDGTCSVTISFSYSNSLSSAGTYTTKKGSGSKSVTLDKIARTSSFTLSSSSLDMGASQTVTISKANSSFTHTVQYTFGGVTNTAATKTGNAKVTFTPPISLATKVPNATSGTCTVKVTTYNGSTSVGSTSKTFTLKVPSSVKPTISLNTTYNNLKGGILVAGTSTVTVKPTGSGAQGSSIKSYAYSGAGLSGTDTGAGKTTGALSAGSHTITVTVTDSRNRTNSSKVSFSVEGYSSPSVRATAHRCDSYGNAYNNGNKVKVRITYSISNMNNNNTNAKQYKIEYKKLSDSSYTTDINWSTLNSYSATDFTVTLNNSSFSTSYSYEIKVSIKDSYETVSTVQKVSTSTATFNIEKNGVGIGKIYEQGALDIGGNVHITGGVIRFGGSPSQNSRIGYYSQAEDGKVGCTFISNGNNNWLRLNDDKTLTYCGTKVALGKFGASGDRWGVIPMVDTNGAMEVGRYIDFHESDTDTSDYSVRITSSGGYLYTSANTLFMHGSTIRLGYNPTDKCTFISNAEGNWLRLTDSGGMTWRGKDVYYEGYDGNIEINRGIRLGNFSNDSFYCVEMKRYNSTVGYIHTKIGVTYVNSEPAMAIEVGEDSNATSGSFTMAARYRFTSTSFTTATSNKVSIGTSSSKFTAVYATNGTIQTSDGRYKYILEDVDNQTCYGLIKDMNLYGYSTLNKRIDEYVDTTEISDELQESSKKDMNLHMGFVAQEIEDSELAKYILIKDETEDGDYVFGVDNYAYTTAIHGALQYEIELRDKQFEELKKENENLKNELQELKQTILKGE